ncbi:hypothetical protein L195_g030418 [Trifolium pratense]|uniref:Uncharacterized protein n=1 Tax=Trifolium pratense TaxID=57577 RepID=A0A2K3L7I6_TRIPR|nr:hypothetical protein L195_g030418 [Trifolium pratense]
MKQSSIKIRLEIIGPTALPTKDCPIEALYQTTKGVEERAGRGGLLHDEHGNWLCVFAQPLGDTNSYLAESWEDWQWQGLLLVRIKSYSKVDLQLDSITVVHMQVLAPRYMEHVQWWSLI